MDSTTISLFKDILKGVGRNPKEGKKKGGIKAHTIIKAIENVPCLVRYSEAVRHDHMFLKEVFNLARGSIITFDKGYVDYAQYEAFTQNGIWYVTRLKGNATYRPGKEFDIPEDADSGVLKDEEIILHYGQGKQQEHCSRRIAYWDSENCRLFEFITNNVELEAEKIALIYKKRWQIELLFKQLKQNFPLKYFLGDNENAIEIQIWRAMLANLLITFVKGRVKKMGLFQPCIHYKSTINELHQPLWFFRRSRRELEGSNKYNKQEYQNSLFPQMRGLTFK